MTSIIYRRIHTRKHYWQSYYASLVVLEEFKREPKTEKNWICHVLPPIIDSVERVTVRGRMLDTN